MALAIKCVHNLPSHLSYVSTLPDVTRKPKCDIHELTHLVPYSPEHHRRSHWPLV